ncbi:pili assembly chaperone [Klebsiella aerogenes]|uniref:pili/flagellar-assembly chaperone n=1 Tax=Klebsiella aerogenes TaxID=548 RepID=UPI00063C278C|nr:pili/flagellar-assembly chaperone [Klebsiella aerogenes]KLF16063.1 pili assembly chaperone [Klebsiella aerogenes]
MNRRFFCWFWLWLLPFGIGHAGVVIGGTRFIYHAERTALSVPLRNTSESDWLVDSHVLSGGRWPGADNLSPRKPPFVVTPPLFLLRAGQENTLRVAWSGEALAQDRETLFTLSIAAIPSGKTGVNSVQMAFRSALKLIYRPVGLTGDPQQAYRQLAWSLTADGLAVRNAGPYYVTLFSTRVNGAPIDAAGVVAPFSTRRTSWCRQATRCVVRWQSLNDAGGVMPPVTVTAQR